MKPSTSHLRCTRRASSGARSYPSTSALTAETSRSVPPTLRYVMYFSYKMMYDTMRYESVYLACSKKLTGSQLSLPHGTNKKN